MKKAILLLFSAALLLSALITSEAAAVLDTDGKELRVGVEYYILPVVRGRGGGLTLKSRNRSCPLNVAQEQSEVARGLSLTFSPVDPKEKVVQVSADTNIVFSAVTSCVQSTVWQLGNTDETTGRIYVRTGGVTGNPGVETLGNWFRIDRSGNDYKLVFCPGVCNFCRPICGELGVFIEKGKRWLGLSGDSFPVMFKKA